MLLLFVGLFCLDGCFACGCGFGFETVLFGAVVWVRLLFGLVLVVGWVWCGNICSLGCRYLCGVFGGCGFGLGTSTVLGFDGFGVLVGDRLWLDAVDLWGIC